MDYWTQLVESGNEKQMQQFTKVESDTIIPKELERTTVSDKISSRLSAEDMQFSESAYNTIFEETVKELHDNVILIRLRQQGLYDCGALSFYNLYDIIHSMLMSKYVVDQRNLHLAKPIKSVPTFLEDYLTSISKSKSSMNILFNQILMTLNQLHSQNNDYATIICRLLQVFNSQPVPMQLGNYLVKVNWDFEQNRKPEMA